jgi:hypothetical protein
MRTPAAQFPFGPALKKVMRCINGTTPDFNQLFALITARTANHYIHDISLRLTAVFYPEMVKLSHLPLADSTFSLFLVIVSCLDV